MKRSLLMLVYVAAMIHFNLDAVGQNIIRLSESTGMPLLNRKYTDLKGSPYFVKDWLKGTVKLGDGESHQNLDMKYDEIADIPIFKNENGEELGFKKAVSEFTLTYPLDGSPKTMVFRSGFTPLKGTSKASFFQVLCDGKTKLLKKNSKFIQDYRAYNSATTTRTVKDKIAYYMVSEDHRPVEFKRDKNSLQTVLGNKGEKAMNYINEKQLDLKDDDDLIEVFNFVN